MEENSFIDWSKAERQLGGSKLLQTYVEKFEGQTLMACLKNIQTNLTSEDWPAVKREAQCLKGAVGYIAAAMCQKLAENLQNAAQDASADVAKIHEEYNSLAEYCSRFQKYLSTYLAKEFNDPEGIFSFRAGQAEESKENEDDTQTFRQNATSSDSTSYVIRRVTPPFVKIYQATEVFDVQEDEMLDAFDELNKQWKCLLV
jgi:HPt (histidine-containing phosphotransfer) domain-containing protein